VYACEVKVGASDLDDNVDANAEDIDDWMLLLGDLLTLEGARKPVNGFSMWMPTKVMTERSWKIYCHLEPQIDLLMTGSIRGLLLWFLWEFSVMGYK